MDNQGARTDLPFDTESIEKRDFPEMARMLERFRVAVEDEFDRVRSLASLDESIRRGWMGL